MHKILNFVNGVAKTVKYNLFYKNATIKRFSIPLSSNIEINKNSNVIIKEGFKIGRNVNIKVRDKSECIIGKDVFFNDNCNLTIRKKIIIGENTIIGPNVIIFDHDHNYKSKDRKNNFICKEIRIGKNVWIGGNACILKGSDIGDNSVIAAGSIVNGKVPNNTIYYSKNKSKNME